MKHEVKIPREEAIKSAIDLIGNVGRHGVGQSIHRAVLRHAVVLPISMRAGDLEVPLEVFKKVPDDERMRALASEHKAAVYNATQWTYGTTIPTYIPEVLDFVSRQGSWSIGEDDLNNRSSSRPTPKPRRAKKHEGTSNPKGPKDLNAIEAPRISQQLPPTTGSKEVCLAQLLSLGTTYKKKVDDHQVLMEFADQVLVGDSKARMDM
ncbi:uncharacterized protein PG986_006428 [Apiospora aurea]|uniref:Uncharacterized protein n=1 Tax=Apiospora aurea TaxID=335848 RepID=A0ABR1QLX7_9PEZI